MSDCGIGSWSRNDSEDCGTGAGGQFHHHFIRSFCASRFMANLRRRSFKVKVGHNFKSCEQWSWVQFCWWNWMASFCARCCLPKYLHFTSRIGEIYIRGQFHQCVHKQLLSAQIPKVQKAAWPDCLFALLGCAHVKAARKMLMKFTSGGIVLANRCASTRFTQSDKTGKKTQFPFWRLKPCASGIWTSLTWLWFFGFRLKPIPDTLIKRKNKIAY